MTKASPEDCMQYSMCMGAVRKLDELYPDGFPMDPKEAQSLVDNGFQVSWLLTPWPWVTKREVLKVWFDRGAANLGLAGDWVDAMSAQLETPNPSGFDALLESLPSGDPVGPPEFLAPPEPSALPIPLDFFVRSARCLVGLLRKEDSSVLYNDKGGTELVAQVAHLLTRTAASGSSTWRAEAKAQAKDILTIFQREGLPPL